MIERESYYTLADRTHFLGAIVFVLTNALLFNKRGALITFLLVVIWGAIKEFWYDERYETVEVRGSNLRDFLGYLLGGLTGLIIVIFALIHKGQL